MSFFLRVRITQTKKKNETIIDNHRSTSFLDGYEKKTATNFIGIPNTCFIKKIVIINKEKKAIIGTYIDGEVIKSINNSTVPELRISFS